MATTALSARAANKAARATRRAEIEQRWHARVAVRMFLDEHPFHALPFIGSALHFGQWAPYRDLIVAANLDHDDLTGIVGRLLRIVALKEMAYEDYLQTPEWKAKAAKAKERYDGRCALDATHAAVDAHHRTYERRGRERDEDLIPLCRDCHQRFHGKRDR